MNSKIFLIALMTYITFINVESYRPSIFKHALNEIFPKLLYDPVFLTLNDNDQRKVVAAIYKIMDDNAKQFIAVFKPKVYRSGSSYSRWK